MHLRNHENLKKMKHKNFTLGGFCLGGFLSGGFLSGGLCPGGFCPRTMADVKISLRNTRGESRK